MKKRFQIAWLLVNPGRVRQVRKMGNNGQIAKETREELALFIGPSLLDPRTRVLHENLDHLAPEALSLPMSPFKAL